MALLKDLLPESRVVNVGRGDVEVFGLDLTQVSTLITKYGKELDALFGGDTPDFKALMVTLPDMVNDLVAMAIQIPDQPDDVARIPIAAKLEILTSMWELSVPDTKKFIAELKSLADKARTLREQPTV